MRKTAPWHDLDYFYDATGRLVVLGDNVAYNLSGSVAVGRVQRIRVQAWKAPSMAEVPRMANLRISIEYKKGYFNHKPGHISLVTNNSNVVTLEHYKLLGGE